MISEELISYEKCHQYARVLGGTYSIPQSDIADIGSDAYLLSLRRSWRAAPSENDEASANRLMYTSVLNVINRRNRRSARVLSDAEQLMANNLGDDDHADDEAPDTTIEPDDGCRFAADIGEGLDWQHPFWLRLFENERRKLKGNLRKTVRALMKDCRLPAARAKIGVSRPTFSTIVEKLRMHFALCFQALRAWRGEK